MKLSWNIRGTYLSVAYQLLVSWNLLDTLWESITTFRKVISKDQRKYLEIFENVTP